MNKLKAYLSLIRIGNCFTASVGTLLGLYFSNILHINNLHIILVSVLSVFAITAFGNVDNDILDIKTDIIEQKNRPLANGKISVFNAQVLKYTLLIFGNVIVIFYPFMLVITIVASTTLFLYNRYLKPAPFFGNFAVAFLTALTFLFGNTASIYVHNTMIYYFLPFIFAFFINLSREIIKDCQDFYGDKESGHRTLPVVKGVKFASYISGISLVLLLISIAIGFTTNTFSYLFIAISALIIAPFSIYITVRILNSQTKSNFKIISKQLKVLMLIGLIALFIEKSVGI